MTAGELHDALSLIGAEAMVEAMAKLESGVLENRFPQDEAGVLSMPPRLTRARPVSTSSAPRSKSTITPRLSPFPAAGPKFEVGGKPERVKLLASHQVQGEGALAAPGTALDDHLTIACGTGSIILVRLQKAVGKALNAEDFLRGTPLPKGTVIA